MDRSAWSKSADVSAGSAGAAARFRLDAHVFYWFTQIVALRDRQIARSLQVHVLRVPEWRVLASLAARGKLTMGELAGLSSIDRTTLTRTIDRMAKDGLLIRRKDAGDQRIMRLALTAGGRATFARLRPIVARTSETALAGLDAKERAALFATLRRMRANLAADSGADTMS